LTAIYASPIRDSCAKRWILHQLFIYLSNLMLISGALATRQGRCRVSSALPSLDSSCRPLAELSIELGGIRLWHYVRCNVSLAAQCFWDLLEEKDCLVQTSQASLDGLENDFIGSVSIS
jgi:hypothetical protein